MKFYEDKTYIDMCRKAGEIQAQKDHGWHRWPKENVGVVHINMKDQKSYAITIDGDFVICRNMETIWLPRLDQLIDMAEPLPRLYSHTLLWELARWEDEYSADMVCPYMGSWEILVLGYLMETKFKKKWSFEKREWVKT